jgi:hypothetical protein
MSTFYNVASSPSGPTSIPVPNGTTFTLRFALINWVAAFGGTLLPDSVLVWCPTDQLTLPLSGYSLTCSLNSTNGSTAPFTLEYQPAEGSGTFGGVWTANVDNIPASFWSGVSRTADFAGTLVIMNSGVDLLFHAPANAQAATVALLYSGRLGGSGGDAGSPATVTAAGVPSWLISVA